MPKFRRKPKPSEPVIEAMQYKQPYDKTQGVHIHEGTWFVQDEHGNQCHKSDADFRDEYEPIE